MKITQIVISIGDRRFFAELYENPTSISLLKQMPFSTELKDFANTEKIFHPEKPLSLTDAPKGYDPNIGDITCYGPWGNVAIFYREHDYAEGLIPMGYIEDIEGFQEALKNTNTKVVFEIKEQSR